MNFYQKLPSFVDFSDLTDDRHYETVPDDWLIIVADIKDSTQAIEAGRYKDVNTLGAAVIVAVHNKLDEGSFPFVFGGDGATMVIPPENLDLVKHQLISLRSMAHAQFNMSLRIGVVPVSELSGFQLEVAKLKIAGKKSLGVFRGGALTKAEDMVKQNDSRYHLTDNADTSNVTADLSGLSCRWHPIPPTRDYAMSLLVKSRSGDAIYDKVLSEISDLYDGKPEQANPINLDSAQYRTIKQCLEDERRYHRNLWSFKFAWRIIEIIGAVLIFRHGILIPKKALKYTRSMGRHSDYRKFDDMLRMVIDCSKSQADQLRSILKSLQAKGEIDYGMHLAKEALMTCFFHGSEEGQHIHFIDGGDGGYVMAAKQLKEQILDRQRKDQPSSNALC